LPPRPSRFRPRGNTHMLDIMCSPQSMERPTMTVPSFAMYSARVQASVGPGLADTKVAATRTAKGFR